MGFGVEIYNNDNVLQITSKFKNLQYIGKFNVTKSIGSKSVIVETNPIELIAFRENSGKYVILEYRDSNGKMSFRGAVNQLCQITCYRFSYTGITAGNHFDIRNEKGEIVFSDSSRFMKVIDFKSGIHIPDWGAGNQLITQTNHLSTIVTAVLVSSKVSTAVWDDFIILWQGQGFVFLPTIVESRVIEDPEASLGYMDDSYIYLVIDVTGY